MDSLFVPFNLMEYAVTLQAFTTTAFTGYTQLFPDPKVDFELLKKNVLNFTQATVEFHKTQSKLDLRDPMAIRMINDQLIFLERTFVHMQTSNNSRHALLEPTRAYPQLGSVFPSKLVSGFSTVQKRVPKCSHQSLIIPMLVHTDASSNRNLFIQTFVQTETCAPNMLRSKQADTK